MDPDGKRAEVFWERVTELWSTASSAMGFPSLHSRDLTHGPSRRPSYCMKPSEYKFYDNINWWRRVGISSKAQQSERAKVQELRPEITILHGSLWPEFAIQVVVEQVPSVWQGHRHHVGSTKLFRSSAYIEGAEQWRYEIFWDLDLLSSFLSLKLTSI